MTGVWDPMDGPPTHARFVAQPITVHLTSHLGGWLWSGHYSQGLLDAHLGMDGGEWWRFGRHGGDRLRAKFERMIQRERDREDRTIDLPERPSTLEFGLDGGPTILRLTGTEEEIDNWWPFGQPEERSPDWWDEYPDLDALDDGGAS